MTYIFPWYIVLIFPGYRQQNFSWSFQLNQSGVLRTTCKEHIRVIQKPIHQWEPSNQQNKRWRTAMDLSEQYFLCHYCNNHNWWGYCFQGFLPLYEMQMRSGMNFCNTFFSGYGNLVPTTTSGRIACIIFALFGIPLLLVTIADIGKFLSEFLSFLYRSYRAFKRKVS